MGAGCDGDAVEDAPRDAPIPGRTGPPKAGRWLVDLKDVFQELLPRHILPTGLLGGALRNVRRLFDPQKFNVFARSDLLIGADFVCSVALAYLDFRTKFGSEPNVLPGLVGFL